MDLRFTALLLVTVLLPAAAEQRIWNTSGFRSFSAGTTVDGGANTFVAADGTVRLINLQDLNNDGNLDLVLPDTHENQEKLDLTVYWAKGGLSASRKTALPTEGARAVAAADLNGDGYPDLVVANCGWDAWRTLDTELDSFIYGGSAQGFSASHRTTLPTQGAVAVTVADVDSDGSPDILFANVGLIHPGIERFHRSYIYWGDHGRYSAYRRTTLETVRGRDVKVADVNRDGIADVIFANEGNFDDDGRAVIYLGQGHRRFREQPVKLPGDHSWSVAIADLNADGYPDIVLANALRTRGAEMKRVYPFVESAAINSFIYWGSAAGYNSSRRTELPTVNASAVAVGDLNRDGRPDVVFANGGGKSSFVYWNHDGAFRPDDRQSLPTLGAAACRIADVNRDGFPDLLLANFDDQRSHDIDSWIYWGSASGFSPSHRLSLPGFGVAGIEVADLDRNGEPDVVFMNKNAGRTGAPVESFVYWGDAQGHFSADRRLAVPTSGTNSYAAVDVNGDGWVDLYFPGGASAWENVGANGSTLFWGSPNGFSRSNVARISSRSAFHGRFADFNRDGYLDLATSEFAPGNKTTNLYWGGPNGFSESNHFTFELPGTRMLAAADLDGNGWLDLIYPTTYEGGKLTIFWNGPDGFSNARRMELPNRAGVSAMVVDLNRDGYLDIVVSNLFDPNPPPDAPYHILGSPKGGTGIYWGGPHGFSAERRQTLPSIANEMAAAADLNRDGWLDLVLTSYSRATREESHAIYWNGPHGFSAGRFQDLPTNASTAAHVNDFNHDGFPDIFFTCHVKDGDHRTNSFLYWGGPQGYSPARRSEIPALGPHFLDGVDTGNIRDRSGHYDYISAPFDAGAPVAVESVSWKGRTPHRTKIDIEVRGAGTKEALAKAEWHTKPVAPHRWMQFKASLISPDSANSPVLESVSIQYSSPPAEGRK